MKNFFDWDYEDDSFDEKKCLENTGNTTGNVFDGGNDNLFGKQCGLLLGESEERMIHYVREDNYLEDSKSEVQVLDYLEGSDQLILEEDQNQFKLNSQIDIKQEFSHQNQQKDQNNVQKQFFEQSQNVSSETKEKETETEKEPEIRLSKKWKDRISSVLEEKNIHQFSAKHNRNMAKFFVRLFSKYIKSNPEKHIFSSETQEKVQQILEKNCISLKDLESLFGGECSNTSRQFLSRVLRTRLRQEVILSQDVQNKAAYLLCSKVYALRCRSRHLTGRLQSR